MELLITIGQLLLSLSILIVLHEFGHFLPARLFGTRVEKFYLFFDPGFSLFKKQIGETEYGIGWLPLGGYVKISGMIDESMDKEQMKQPPQPWEFRSKTAWQRLVIMLGGVTVNFILGFLIFAMTLYVWGEEYFPNDNVTAGIYADSLGQEMGLRTGDKLLLVGDQPVERFGDRQVLRGVAINGARQLTVERDGQRREIAIDNEWADMLTQKKNKDNPIFSIPLPFVIAGTTEDGPGDKAGLQRKDRIVSVNGTPIQYFNEYVDIMRNEASNDVRLVVQDSTGRSRDVNFTLDENRRMAVSLVRASEHYKTDKIEFGFLESFPAGWDRGKQFISDQLNAFGQIGKGNIQLTESLGGFRSIARMFGSTWNWERFWVMTASLSLILAVMNLLPIPALDGGHVVFLLYEVITGRKPSDTFMEYATIVGFVIVLGLIVLSNGIDWWPDIKELLGL